ncbi:MAG: alpha/beta hydrolase, partial [Opitutales bacterium]|nr:alpha/beta hydrolase [Opitutales bacterium]
KRVTRLQNVSVPTLTIYKPDPKIDTGSSIMIAPGGGFTILAYDKEGTEVAEWANSIGMTAIVLKYRVPGNVHNPEKPWLPAAQDGQRAMSLVRSRSDELGIDPDRIGIMGFSAGGAPVNYTAFASERLYEAVDRHDDHSFRPAFAAPIYSGVWMPEGMDQSDAFPPVFIVITYDDKDRSIGLAEAYIKLKKANVSAEMHIYSEGGHGYGLRRTEKPVTSWPDRMEDWLKLKGFLDR